MLGNDGANEAFNASDLPAETLAEADHLHLTGQNPTTAATLARDAAAADVPVSFDPGRRLPTAITHRCSHMRRSCLATTGRPTTPETAGSSRRADSCGQARGLRRNAPHRRPTVTNAGYPMVCGHCRRGRRVRCRDLLAAHRRLTRSVRSQSPTPVAHSQRSHPAHGRHSTGSPSGSLSTRPTARRPIRL